MSVLDLQRLVDRLGREPASTVHGIVHGAVGLIVRASLPGTWIGELCEISTSASSKPVLGEVVGFRGDDALLMPLGDLRGIGTRSVVRRLGEALAVRASSALVGRVLDGLGRPIDGRPLDPGGVNWPILRPAPPPLARTPIDTIFATGVRAIDAFLTIGEGQRIGIFAGPGAGKSTLLGMIARYAEADVVVVGLVGERGREVREFLETELAPDGRSRAVVVVATSDEPALVRIKAAYVATAIAEYFRSSGARVLLLMDSVTRFARARREVGLAAGEPPARAGFPPSVFAELPRLLERSGNDDVGSITAFYTVLVEGDDEHEPVSDESRSILDGHIVLSADRAARGSYPAIDVAASVSRVMSRIVDRDHLNAARHVKSLMGAFERERDLLLVGAYEAGTDPRVDEAVAKIDEIEELLAQRPDEREGFELTRAWLLELAEREVEIAASTEADGYGEDDGPDDRERVH